MITLLNDKSFVVFSTREYANKMQISIASASQKLGRVAKQGAITSVIRGVWANTNSPWFTPYLVLPYLLRAEQGCVSFISALHLYGMLSQIPTYIYVATTGQPRKVRTSVANFELIQVKPTLMRSGIDWSETHIPFRMATAEKALFDTLYIATRKGRRFAHLPEINFEDVAFDIAAFNQFVSQVESKSIRIAIAGRLERLLGLGLA